MPNSISTPTGARTPRKMLITVAAWGDIDPDTGIEEYREILGARTEDSSIELNPDVSTTTDILGKTYIDVNKTEPQQSFDPFHILGGSDLADYLTTAVFENDIAKYSGTFTIYNIEAYKATTDGTVSYKCTKQTGCTIVPTSIGGDATALVMPIDVYYSNEITVGSVDKLSKDFQFTPKA